MCCTTIVLVVTLSGCAVFDDLDRDGEVFIGAPENAERIVGEWVRLAGHPVRAPERLRLRSDAEDSNDSWPPAAWRDEHRFGEMRYLGGGVTEDHQGLPFQWLLTRWDRQDWLWMTRDGTLRPTAVDLLLSDDDLDDDVLVLRDDQGRASHVYVRTGPAPVPDRQVDI